MAISTFVLTLATVADNRKNARETRREQRKLRAVDQAQVSENAARERRNQIRQARSQAAQIENTAAGSGLTSSSASIAGAAGVNQQAALNIGDINQTVSFNQLTSQMEQDIFEMQQPSNFQYAAQIAQGYQSYTDSKTPKE